MKMMMVMIILIILSDTPPLLSTGPDGLQIQRKHVARLLNPAVPTFMQGGGFMHTQLMYCDGFWIFLLNLLLIVSIHRIFNDDGDDDDDGDDGSSLASSVVINTNPRAAFVSLCQTQMRPNETQTNLLTGFVSLQTDISWQPERNICENEILDPHVTGRLSYGWESTSVLPKHFFEQQLHFLRVHVEPVCSRFAHFFSFGFNLKFVRWAAGEGGACKFCAIEGRILLRKWFRLIFGTILVEPRGLNANGTKF